MQAGKGQIDQAEQNTFPSVLCRQADFGVEGRVELKAEGGAERGKEFSGLSSISVSAGISRNWLGTKGSLLVLDID